MIYTGIRHATKTQTLVSDFVNKTTFHFADNSSIVNKCYSSPRRRSPWFRILESRKKKNFKPELILTDNNNNYYDSHGDDDDDDHYSNNNGDAFKTDKDRKRKLKRIREDSKRFLARISSLFKARRHPHPTRGRSQKTNSVSADSGMLVSIRNYDSSSRTRREEGAKTPNLNLRQNISRRITNAKEREKTDH